MVGSGKLKVSYNKALRLSNVLIKEIIQVDMDNSDRVVELMENYIKSKGAQPIGPLIQHTTVVDVGGEVRIVIKLMRQANKFIKKIEAPYSMESTIRITNCLYTRFAAEKEKIKFAYDKLGLISFEEDIPLTGDSYTIFVENNDDMIVADVFMEKAINE